MWPWFSWWPPLHSTNSRSNFLQNKGVATDDAGRIKIIEFRRFFFGLGGWKRTRAFQEARAEDPGNAKLKRFDGYPAIIYPEKIAEDPATCQHIVTDANARNKTNTEGTIIDRLLRLKEIRESNVPTAQPMNFWVFLFSLLLGGNFTCGDSRTHLKVG